MFIKQQRVVLSITLGALFSTILLSGCATTTPTTTTKMAYVVYDVKTPTNVSYQDVVNAFVSGTKEYLSGAAVQEKPPPYPLPDQPGRFQNSPMSQMSGMGGLSAIAAMSGAVLPSIVSCPGASVIARGADNSYSKYGKNATYTFCLYPYKGGYQADAVGSYTSQSGFSSNPNVLGAELGGLFTKAVGLGSPSQFIEDTFGNVRKSLASTGSKVTVVDSFDPFSTNQ